MPNALDHRIPIYVRLRNEFAQHIAEGHWAFGSAIPPETELASKLQVSMGTIRKAIETLVDDGLLVRTRGRGTFIRRPSFEKSLYRAFRDPDLPVEAAGEGYPDPITGVGPIQASAVLVDPEPPQATLDKLRLRKVQDVIELRRLTSVGGKPELSERIWLPRKRFHGLLELGDGSLNGLLYPIYEASCSQLVASVVETLSIDSATEADGVTGARPGEPMVVLTRIAYDYAGEPMEYRAARGAAGDFTFSVEIR
jgi:GntR family transcriptional regulator